MVQTFEDLYQHVLARRPLDAAFIDRLNRNKETPRRRGRDPRGRGAGERSDGLSGLLLGAPLAFVGSRGGDVLTVAGAVYVESNRIHDEAVEDVYDLWVMVL